MSQSAAPVHEGLIPHLVCSPATEAMEFYSKAFGAVEMFRLLSPDGQRLMHGSMKIGNSVFFLADDFPEYCNGKSQTPKALGGTPVTIHRNVPNVDAAMEQAVQTGATIMMPAADMFWGDRYGVVTDPFGHNWSLATHIKDMTPEEMNAGMQEAFSHAP